MKPIRYVLLTAARNEAAFIERPLEAVVRQTVLPVRWIIVSDGSTDGTDNVVRRYASRYPFIELIRREAAPQRDFRSKALAIRQAYACVRELAFGYVGNLDADIAFGPDYYERTLGHLERNPRVGLITGRRHDRCGDGFKPMPPDMVTGAVQLFRRDCWEAIGGYLPLRRGGEDTVAGVMARMQSWQVVCLEDAEVFHDRATGSAQGGRFRRCFNEGAQARAMGFHPLFYIAMAIRDARWQGLGVPLAASLLGYAIAACRPEERVVPEDLVQYLRHDQMQRLGLRLRALRGRLGITRRSVSP